MKIWKKFLMVLLFVLGMVVTSDYLWFTRFQSRATLVTVGADMEQVLNTLGAPQGMSNGHQVDELGNRGPNYQVLEFCTRFDWNGSIYRNDSRTYFYRLLSRIDPAISLETDVVVKVWIADGRVAHVDIIKKSL